MAAHLLSFPLPSNSLLSPHLSLLLPPPKLLPLASLAPLHNSPDQAPLWKPPLPLHSLKQHAFFLSNKWNQHVLQNSALHNCAVHDIFCSLAVLAGSLGWIRLFDVLVQNRLIDQKLSRKLAHISTGVLFTLTWPMYSSSPWSRLFALAIPLANVIKLLLCGLGILKDEGLVKSLSREGSPKELLRGPLLYVLVLSLCTVAFWRDSPVGAIALAVMCGGDGIADIVGRRFGGVKLPYNPSKSWAGSIAMFFFGFAISIGLVYYFTSLGFYRVDWANAIKSLALISSAATLVESLPIDSQIDDNLSVPMVSVLLGVVLFPSASL